MPGDPPFQPGSLPEELLDKLERLRTVLEDCQPVLLAVSGGIDSRVLAACARLWSLEATGVIFTGPQFARAETAYAAEYLRWLGLEYTLQPAETLDLSEVRSNARQRCYVCKKALFSKALDIAERAGGATVLEGSQRSDETGHRPGRQALDELGIQSPLREAGFFKADVRALAERFGLPCPQQPARPCLLTRFAYDTIISREMLQRVAELEEAIGRLGFSNFRVRVPGGDRCLLQIAEEEWWLAEVQAQALQALVAESGFSRTSLHVEPSVSGFFDAPGQQP